MSELEQQLDLSKLPPAANEDRELGTAANDPAELARAAAAGPQLSDAERAHLETVGFAAMLTEMGAQVATRRWPVIVFTKTEKNAVCDALVPVLKKYDVRSAFLEKYKEEFALGMVLAGIVKAKRELLEQEKPAEPERPAGPVGDVKTHLAQDEAIADPFASLRR